VEYDCAGNMVSRVDGLMLRWKVVGLLAGTLLCWELIVRLFVLSPAQEVFDEERGYVHAPLTNILRTYEGYTRLTLDQFGLNNGVLPETLPVQRVAVVGDSFVEAYQVMREDNFISRLGVLWQDVFLFNMGGAGAVPDQELLVYKTLEPILKPTHILLCLNSSDLYELLSAQAVRDQQGKLQALKHPVDDYTTFKSVKLWVYAHSALITHLKWKYENDIRAWWSGHNEKRELRKHHKLQGKQLDEAIARYRFILKKFKQSRATLTLLLMPELTYLPHHKAKQRIRQGRVVLTQEAQKMGVPVLDSNAVFAQDFEKTGVPAIGFANTHYGKGHINAYGHGLLAHWLDSQRAVIVR